MSAMPGRNPFRPGVGTPPSFLAGRSAELRRFRRVLAGAPELPANVRLTGLRGVGKTVLLQEFLELARGDAWLATILELEPRHNDETALAEGLVAVLQREKQRASRLSRAGAAARSAAEALRFTLTIEDLELSFDLAAKQHTLDLAAALLDATSAALRNGRRGFALLLDEAQVIEDERRRGGQYPVSMLIAAVSALQKAGAPIALVLCGLPSLASNLLRARTYTERMFRAEDIGRLDATEAREALVRPLDGSLVGAADDLVDEVVAEVEGYPYFIQLWGAELWDAAGDADVQYLDRSLLSAVRPDIHRRLDTEFYEPRVRTLTPAEEELLLASGRCPYPPLRVSDLRARSDKSEGNVNVLVGRLAKQGVLHRRRKGEYDYTAPLFHEYLQRQLTS